MGTNEVVAPMISSESQCTHCTDWVLAAEGSKQTHWPSPLVGDVCTDGGAHTM